jgi:hypothetical protein
MSVRGEQDAQKGGEKGGTFTLFKKPGKGV